MTEGQWVWMAVHMSLDDDIELEKTCGKCKAELQKQKCLVCREDLDKIEDINPHFDDAAFEKLKNFSNMGSKKEREV